MAKHLRQDAGDGRSGRTDRSGRAAPQGAQRRPRSALDDTASLPYGEVASYRGPYGNAVRRDSYYLDEVPARGGVFRIFRGILLVAAWALRLCAHAALLVVTLNVLSLWPLRSLVAYVDDTIAAYAPWCFEGPLVVDTPFGGTFLGGLALACVGLLVADWLLCKLRALIR